MSGINRDPGLLAHSVAFFTTFFDLFPTDIIRMIIIFHRFQRSLFTPTRFSLLVFLPVSVFMIIYLFIYFALERVAVSHVAVERTNFHFWRSRSWKKNHKNSQAFDIQYWTLPSLFLRWSLIFLTDAKRKVIRFDSKHLIFSSTRGNIHNFENSNTKSTPNFIKSWEKTTFGNFLNNSTISICEVRGIAELWPPGGGTMPSISRQWKPTCPTCTLFTL